MTSLNHGTVIVTMSHDDQNMAVLGKGRLWLESCPGCHLVGFCRALFLNQFSLTFSLIVLIKIWKLY